MSSSALPPAEDKRAFVRAMFDRIAPRYDALNRLITFGLDQRWRRGALATAAVGPGDLVIDLACGTGDLAELAARRGARAIGIDFAPEMLRAARKRTGLPLVQGDGLALPFRDGCAQVLTCGFALRNFTDLDVVFAECARVLERGGRLALLEVDEPRVPLLRALHRLHFRHIVPRLGAWLADAEAYRYLPESAVYLPSNDELRAKLEKAGFADVSRHEHLFGAVQHIAAFRT